MRTKRHDHAKLKVCRAYERLRRRWRSLVEGETAQLDRQSHEDATTTAHEDMVEHREGCEVCKREDLALKDGDHQEMLKLELSQSTIA